MERNYGAEIDALKKELYEIKELLRGKAVGDGEVTDVGEAEAGTDEAKDAADGSEAEKKSKLVQKIREMSQDTVLNSLMMRIQDECESDGSTGRVVYTGVFASGGRQSNWIGKYNTDRLLELIDDRTAEKVLSCVGSGDRLCILSLLLRKTMTVAQIVSEGGFNSTGQVYHHLNALIAADLVKEDTKNKGAYIISPHRVQGIIMILAGISDMLTGNYCKEQAWY